ncbi:UDP-N-acetylglucosamine--N-acetylmuramyl-(pentapeptide) pyrophosphoryl-undecaprenol N-acetylglucosamine transferase [Zingiber officinale]|uniref:UDP-N-acetylglucosamine--N-acetylmuramyl- (pentapeptide) pyrophosphoryl-undecaprenol N-acetylglucosamine transferase n=1 Tax=Zingiber officinale TaxID=94328 RepID=UPI001C4BEB76|nr:UDP-N-acetylglucosamine--N-acetylmuramyl-(pentapeptide) pyrophosphoryl-undecaprenol N-acetylglucosamine transferase [Zingiber officinale]
MAFVTAAPPPALFSLSPSSASSSISSFRIRASSSFHLPPSPTSRFKPRQVASPPPPAAVLRVLFAAGGTGGHVYPAIAIAEALKDASPDAEILFVGSDAGLEGSAVPSAGFALAAIPRARPSLPPFSSANLLLPFHFFRAVSSSVRIVLRFQPSLVVGTGGYIAAPVCLAAALCGVKIVIQEQNSYPGLVNQLTARFADKIFVAFNGCVKHLERRKCLVYGNPVRLALRRFVSKAVARSHFFPKAGSKSVEEKAQVVLVLGGSGGAEAINIAALNMYSEMLSRHKNRFIIWQTGADGFNEMECLVKINRRLFLTPFLHELDLAYAAADVVVSRSGAMACTEILTTGKPSILIPSPDAADGHQIKNAYIMADVAGSKVITEDELDSSSLEDAIDNILGNESLMAEMSERALSAARPEAAVDVAKCIISLINSTSSN